MTRCISVFDEDGIYDDRDDFHECQRLEGHIEDGSAHKCHCGVMWVGSTATTGDLT